MRQLPHNVKVGPCRMHLCVADEDDDLFDDWDESYRVTPPPVDVSTSCCDYEANKAEPVASNKLGFCRAVAIWAAMLVGLAVALGVSWVQTPSRQTPVVLRAWVSDIDQLDAAAWLRNAHLDLSSVVRQRRADAEIRHDGYASIPGGVLYTPETFSSTDGSYDLLLHFHGNVKVVVENAVAAKLNAPVAVVNLGTGSAHYQDFFAIPGMYEELLDHIQAAMRRRGLNSPHLRRVALSAWSAGYGAISNILMERKGSDPLDAILVLDGIHTGYQPGRPGELLTRRLAPFEEAAHAAASGDLLFSITYSEIDPPGYAGSRATAEYLLGVAQHHGKTEQHELAVPTYYKLDALRGAVSKQDARRLQPMADLQVRGFHVRGYRGKTRGHHMAHLFQMGATVLSELERRWSSYSGHTGRTDAVLSGRVRMRAHRGRHASGKQSLHEK